MGLPQISGMTLNGMNWGSTCRYGRHNLTELVCFCRGFKKVVQDFLEMKITQRWTLPYIHIKTDVCMCIRWALIHDILCASNFCTFANKPHIFQQIFYTQISTGVSKWPALFMLQQILLRLGHYDYLHRSKVIGYRDTWSQGLLLKLLIIWESFRIVN